jgi:phage-related protein
MANTITLTFAGDDKSLSRTFDKVGEAALDMGDDLKKADAATSRLSDGVVGMNDKIDSAESKFMGAADLADGLSSAMGLNVGPAIEMSRAFADMAGGFTALVGPALEGMTKKLATSTMATNVQTFATKGLNAAMRASPILMVVAGVAALIAIFILAYKKVDWFRNGVNAAMDGIKTAVGWVGDKFDWMKNKITDGVTSAAKKIGTIAGIITTPYRLAFNGIADLWNNTIGKLSFSIPGWVPGIGGNGFDVPDIPKLASGGVANAGRMHVVGEQGPELFVPGMTGTVIPNHALGGAGVTVELRADASDPWVRAIRHSVRVLGGGDVQKAFGS